jgi:Ca-activated chloride channel family protein
MNFADPIWLFLLVPLAAWLFFKWRAPGRDEEPLPYSDLDLVQEKLKDGFFEERILAALKAAGLVFILIALARPQSVSTKKEPPVPVVDIVLCLDTSLSMSAIDFDPQNRLEAAKSAAEEFITKRPLDRIGLVVFGGKPITQCPLTLDHETLIEFLRSIPVDATRAEGTAVGDAIALGASRLSEGEAKSKVMILLTDGRNNRGTLDPVTASRAAADLGVKIYTIGCAVPGGGKVPVDDPVFGKRLVQMAEDLDESSLIEIAGLTSAKYFRVTSKKNFGEIYDEIDRMEKTRVDAGIVLEHKDRYVPFLIVALLLFGGEIFLRNTVWKKVP